MPEMNVINNDKFVVPRSTSESPPPPPPRPPQPRSPLDPPGPVVAAARRPLRSAAGDTAFPFAEADDEAELPPSYEISTLPRPSDAHIHVTVRSNTSASSLPSLMAGRAGGRGSINTQGYLLTAPMSHTTTASSNTAASAYYNLRGLDSRRPSRCDHQWDHWDRRNHHHHHREAGSSGSGGCCGFISGSDDGCCFSSRGGCFFSDRDGCCFSDRGGCCFSDREGCCCSDERGCCFSSSEGACCSDGPGCCCSRFEDERLPVMENNVRFA
ncbi:hypothetical protein M441DRAFT_166427 [Trichoderma asperellum CBS 433.97]|uniref:Uncharacterized protein n=1 Tax=Trichoderma asperellum (strain ATCC 204424 / CBS 433.97 / NBRC 101777) TaxID=1042311 RepID=A0A2T3Z8Z9_TRIA4|nr:hypothetical protein M441DRAFT_166427 [Trichoderma asperellum CBS 433.97]PTB41277.1 hypothetical protein M441DRAFT_166427 [Trichoderma asperellum CBS 433.97]